MKTKTKTFALLGIAIVLCSMFLVALPVIAAEQTMQKVSVAEVTASSEDDGPLGIYGNANMDDTIDMRDTTYIKLVIFGKKPKTDLADANYDGKVSMLDVGQTKLIILGKEKELTFIDTAEKIVTIKKPIERIVICSCGEQAEALKILGVMEKVVGVSSVIQEDPAERLFPELQDLPNVGSWNNYEAILSLNPDVVIVYSWATTRYPEMEKSLPGVTVLRFNLYRAFQVLDEIRKLGYILDREEEAQKYIDFVEEHLSIVEEKVETLSEDEKPRVYIVHRAVKGSDIYKTYNKLGAGASPIKMAGGRNIAEDMPGDMPGSIDVDPEWVIGQNPEIIVRLCMGFFDGYGEDDMSMLKDARGYVMNHTELKYVDAVQNEKVYAIGIGVIYLPSFPTGIAYLAKWFHPELFEDLDPQAIHQEYLDRYHKDIKNFVFVYPLVKE